MKNKFLIVGLVLLVFFVISFLTNILGALNPAIKESFGLEFSSLGFMTMAFFSAYGIMSIPAGMLLERYKEKRMMLTAFGLAAFGAGMFAIFPFFITFLISLFFIGAGMAMLQVVINPLLRTSGGEDNFAFFSVLGQLFFGLAGVAGPYFYSYLMMGRNKEVVDRGFIDLLYSLVPQNMSWSSIYIVFAAISIIMFLVILFFKFPEVTLKTDERTGEWTVFRNLIRNRTVLLFFIGIFCYVGFEQGVSFWMSQFLEIYHGIDPDTTGAEAVGNFWGLLTLGCFLGLLILKFIDSKKVLLLFSGLAFISLGLALFGSARISLVAFPMVGFFASVMWSVIVSLALNSVKEHHGSMTGILCTGIVGGAIAPFIVGWIGDMATLKIGMLFNFLTLSYILMIGIWAKPLVKNKIYRIKRQTAKAT